MNTQGKKSSPFRRENYSICNECGAHLQGDVFTHMKDVHCDSYFYKCHLCRNYSGYSRSNLFQHQKDKHEVSHYYIACPICMKFNSAEEKEVKIHLANVHCRNDNQFVCNSNFKIKSDSGAHFKEISSPYGCIFDKCQTVCQNSMQLFQHYMNRHFPKLNLFYNCSECDDVFPKKNSLNQHKWDKHGLQEDEEEEETSIEFHCTMCSFTTFNKRHYEQHSTNKHPNCFFNCTYQNCNYQTKLFWSLTQHTIDKHLSDTFLSYDCYECEDWFSQVHSLIQHLRDKHSIVDTCGLCNTYEFDLSDHILSIPDHSCDVFSCKWCDEEYEDKAELVDHLSDNHVSITPLLRKLCYGN